MTTQDPAHGPRCQTQLGAEPVLTATMLHPSGQDRVLDLGCGPQRTGVRGRRSIQQPSLALGVETGHPTMGALPRDPHRFRNVSHWPPLFTHPFHQQCTATKGQTGVSVGHENLRAV